MVNLLKIAQEFKHLHILILILLVINSTAVSAKNACVKSSFVRVEDFFNRNVDKTNSAATMARDILRGDITLYHKRKETAAQTAAYYYHSKGHNAVKLLDAHLREIKQLQESLQQAKRKINKAKSMSVDMQKLSELLRISCLNRDRMENSSLANEMHNDGSRLLAKQNKIYAALLGAEALFDKELAYTKKINKWLQQQRKDEQIVELRMHQQQAMQFDNKLKFIDKNIHQHLQTLNHIEGVAGLVFIYHLDKNIAAFTTEVAALADEYDNSFSTHLDALVKYSQQNGKEGIDKQNIVAQYRSRLRHLQEHIRWYNSAEIAAKMAEQQELAYKILGPADKGNLVELYKSAENLFFRFAANSQAANSYEMWKVAQVIGVRRFAAETGIDLSKNSPQRQKQRFRKQFKDTKVEPIIFGAPPEGVEYPHTYEYFKSEISDVKVNSREDLLAAQTSDNIINRNLLAVNALASKNLRSEIKQALNDYQQTMDKFQSTAGQRFKITNWQKLPVATETWLSLAQIWSIKEYQLMLSRFQAIKQMADAKADYDWAAGNKKLGFNATQN